MRMCQRILVVTVGIFVATVVSAQATVTLPSPTVLPGALVSLPVTLDNSFPVVGFQLGIEMDSKMLSLLGVDSGAVLSATNSGAGADYLQVDADPPFGSGLTVACVVSFGPVLDSIPIGSGQELLVLQAFLLPAAPPAATTDIEFSDVIGFPQVQTLVTELNPGPVTSIPIKINGTLTVDDPTAQPYTLTTGGGSGLPGGTVVVPVCLDNPMPVAAMSCGFAVEPPDVATITDMIPGSVLDSTNGGAGPDYFAVDTAPVGGPGATFGTIVSLMSPFDAIPSGVGQEVLLVDLLISPGATIGDTAELVLKDNLGAPPVPCILELSAGPGGGSAGVVVPTTESAELVTVGIAFVRGDCDASGSATLADAIYQLGFVFGGTSTTTCEDSCDSNDDGSIDVSDPIFGLGALFAGGPPIPAPSPGCGIDTTPDGLDCMSFPACP